MASNLADKTADLTPTAPDPTNTATARRRPSGARGQPPARRRRPRPSRSPESVPVDVPRRVPAWEWGLTVVTLFLLGRTPVLFYRERVGELFDAGPAFSIWQDDAVVRLTFAAVLMAMYVVAARRCQPRTLLRQPLLVAFLVMSFASVTWSIEPTASMWRASLFAGTAVLGWYIGERYTVRELVGIVGAVAAIGAMTSLVAVLAWPGNAQATNQLEGVWSGAYVNRNLLALVMGFGLLTLPYLWISVPIRRRVLLIAIGALELFFFIKAGSRTPLVGLAAAASVGIPLVGVRHATTRALKPSGGAFAVGLVAGYVGLIVHWNWGTLVEWLDRRVDLTKRTTMWAIDRYYSDLQPWKGWGFEAIWTHPPTIGVAETIYGKFPYSSHSGYYEILLSVGRVGLVLFAGFLVVAAWRAFRFAWEGRDPACIFPLTFLVFAAVVNVSESLFVSSETTWALTVAAAVAATGVKGQRRTVS